MQPHILESGPLARLDSAGSVRSPLRSTPSPPTSATARASFARSPRRRSAGSASRSAAGRPRPPPLRRRRRKPRRIPLTPRNQRSRPPGLRPLPSAHRRPPSAARARAGSGPTGCGQDSATVLCRSTSRAPGCTTSPKRRTWCPRPASRRSPPGAESPRPRSATAWSGSIATASARLPRVRPTSSALCSPTGAASRAWCSPGSSSGKTIRRLARAPRWPAEAGDRPLPAAPSQRRPAAHAGRGAPRPRAHADLRRPRTHAACEPARGRRGAHDRDRSPEGRDPAPPGLGAKHESPARRDHPSPGRETAADNRARRGRRPQGRRAGSGERTMEWLLILTAGPPLVFCVVNAGAKWCLCRQSSRFLLHQCPSCSLAPSPARR